MNRSNTRRAFVGGALATCASLVLARASSTARKPVVPPGTESGHADALVRLAPSCFEHVVALVALWRPGPLECGLFDEYVERRHGRRASVAGVLPAEGLAVTYGLLVYEQQLAHIVETVAGFAPSEAERFRRALLMRDGIELEQQRSRFLAGASERGCSPDDAERRYDVLAHFAPYTSDRGACVDRATRLIAEARRVEPSSA